MRNGCVLPLLLLPALLNTSRPALAQRIAIPSYFYPGPLWTRLESAVPIVGFAIINPDSGPGKVRDPVYARQVSHSQARGLRVLGYVHTSYGKRDAQAVRDEIDHYFRWYGVDGIFLDEASDDAIYLSYYAALNKVIKARRLHALTVLNPGTETAEAYLSVADIIVTFEGDYDTYAKTYAAPDWIRRYPARRFWHVIYHARNAKEMQAAVALGKQRNAGWLYVTPATLPNPYDTLPPNDYWSDELAAVSAPLSKNAAGVVN